MTEVGEVVNIDLPGEKSKGSGGLVEDVNSKDELGWTSLMHAVHCGHHDLAREMLSQGADVSICNHHGVTAFTMAILNSKEDFLHLLYSRLTPDIRQRESNVALLVACANGLYDTVKWLLEHTQAQADYISPLNGVTPLMMVALSGQDCAMADLLLSAGADLRVTNPLGQDASELALAAGNGQLFLLLNPASPAAKDIRFTFDKVEDTIESIDPAFTDNQLQLDIQNNIVNSPYRPVFKTSDENISVKTYEDKALLTPSARSVFLLSPQQRTPCPERGRLHCQYNLAAIVTPRKFEAKTPNRGKKRKLSSVNGISSWFKKITKRRSKSLADEDDYNDLNIHQKGIDFLKLLKGMELDEFFPIFKEQELDIWTFLSLTVQDLAAMGIDKPSFQIRILEGIQTLRTTQI